MCVSGPYLSIPTFPLSHFCRGSEKAHVTRRLSARITVLFAAACLSIPTVGIAQQASQTADSGWWDWALPKIQIQIGDDGGKQQDKGKNSGAKSSQGNSGKAKGVPAFCRSGAGHPVHGWQWCVEKGYKMGWSSTAFSGAEFRGGNKARRGAELDSGNIDEILGNEIDRRWAGGRRAAHGAVEGATPGGQTSCLAARTSVRLARNYP